MLENQMPDNANKVAAIDPSRQLFQINELKDDEDGEDGNDLVDLLDFASGSVVSHKRADLKVTKVPIGLEKGDVVEITSQSDESSDGQDRLMDSNGTIVVVIECQSDKQEVLVKRSSESEEYDIDIQNLMVPEQMLSFKKNDILKFVCDYKYGSEQSKRMREGQNVKFVHRIENSNLVTVTSEGESRIEVSKYLLRIDLNGFEPIEGHVATLLCDYKPSSSERLDMKKNDQVSFQRYTETEKYFATVVRTSSYVKAEVPASLLKNVFEDINEEINYCSAGEIVEFAKRYYDASGHEKKYYEVLTKAMIKSHTQSPNKATIEVFTKDKKTIVVPIQYLKIPEEVMNFDENEALELRRDFVENGRLTHSQDEALSLKQKLHGSEKMTVSSKSRGNTFNVPNYRLRRQKAFFEFTEGELVEFILPFTCYGNKDKEFDKGKCVRFVRFEEGSHSRAIVTSRSIFKKKEEFCVPSRLLQRKLFDESTKANIIGRKSSKT
ncbi:MAG: hypothetical protein MHMPM18_001244 [Marteilia pararefringens]